MKSTGFIKDGVYYKGLATDSRDAPAGDQPLHKGWSHDRQREMRRQELLQPYKDNKPSGEFIRSYPEESQKYFTPEQIRKHSND